MPDPYWEKIGQDVKAAERSRKFLTLTEVAERWKVSRATVVRTVKAGALRAIDIGLGGNRSNFRIRIEDLMAYEDSKRNRLAR